MAITTLGAFPGANDKDKSARIPAAISALNKALAGDQQALTYMRAQAVGSATAVGKDAFRRALAIYDQQKPAGAPSSSATPPVSLIPIPKPLPQLPPTLDVAPEHDPTGPPDRRFGWRWDSSLTGGGQWRGTWVYSMPDFTPPDIGGMTVPVSQAKPIGFDTAHTPLTFPPGGSVTVTGMRPGQVKPITVGSPDGGVITSTPAPDYSGPTPAALAPADFGYVPPSATPAGGKTVVSSATPPTAGDNNKILLVLAAGVVLWLLVEGKRK
jgi:hypothetical protein